MSRNTPPTRTLRPHPDLDQLKRQAKELLDAFRAGDPEVGKGSARPLPAGRSVDLRSP